MKEKLPPVPMPQTTTLRQQMAALLAGEPCSAFELSGALGIPEKSVYEHLEHLRRTLHQGGRQLLVLPATCRKCGFVFGKRERLQRPGRCPLCRGQSLSAPLFAIR